MDTRVRYLVCDHDNPNMETQSFLHRHPPPTKHPHPESIPCPQTLGCYKRVEILLHMNHGDDFEGMGLKERPHHKSQV